jgi:hypothetical protein
MKWLALLLIVGIGFVGYCAHVQSLKKAELAAYNQAQAVLEQERVARAEQERKEAAARERRPLMAISNALEPLIAQLEAPLKIEEPADYVPVVQGTKLRIMDHRVDAEPARVVVFDRAGVLLNYLGNLADERTKALKTMLRNRGGSALSRADGPNFFNQGVAKHWDDTLMRARPVVNQLMEQLRAAEREWNKQARQSSYAEDYDLVGLVPVMLSSETPVQTSTPATVSRVVRRVTPGVGANGQVVP